MRLAIIHQTRADFEDSKAIEHTNSPLAKLSAISLAPSIACLPLAYHSHDRAVLS